MGRKTAGTDLTPYVPRVAASWATESPDAVWRAVDGTLVFADVSGFTALSERLAARGPIGAEELTDVLGRCFSDLLAVAYAEGGSLLKFGGDALLLLFDGPLHAVRATRAAVGMRSAMRAMGRLTTSVGSVRLRMSQGVHSGELHLFRVGQSHKELLIVGPGASTTVEMESAADAGEIVVSEATAASIDPNLLGERKAAGRLLRNRTLVHLVEGFPAVTPAPAAAADGLSAPLREHLAAVGAESDHRHVAIGFVHFDGADGLLAQAGPAALANALDELVTTTQRAATAEEVTFLASDIDRDGGKLILAAGAPRALEDAEGRLLRAVRQIVDGRGRLPVRVGVNRGHVFAGAVGPPYRRTYTIMGDAVNLAARLMAKAQPGEIVVSPAALSLSRTAFDVGELPPFHVKGKAAAIQAFALGPVAGTQEIRVASRAPLVGRAKELDALVAAVHERLPLVSITGEVGAGKSRLVEEARERADTPFRVVGCEQYERTTPYFAFRVLLRHVLELPSQGAVAPDIAAASITAVAPQLEVWAPLVGDVIDARIPETEATAWLGPQFRRDRTASVVSDLLRGAFADGVVLGFDDVHWLDDASCELLTHLIGASQRTWSVVVTRRSGVDGGFAPDGARDVSLGRLDDDDARALLASASSDSPLPPHVGAAVLERAAGNPLFLEELVRMAGSGHGDELPDSLEAVVAAQIDSLDPADRRLLRYAAVLGDSFDAALFAEVVADASVERPAFAARRLKGFVQSTRDGRLQFRHRLLRDVAYQSLPFRQRQDLHARAAQVIERTAGDAIEERAAVLSLHCFHAQQFEKCWEHATIAARRAHDMWASVEAVELYARALAAARRCPDTVARDDVRETWVRLAKVHQLTGRFDEADEAYRAARKLADDPVAIARLCERHAQLADRRGLATSRVRWIRRGLRAIDGIAGEDARFERAHLLTMLADSLYQRGDLRTARRRCNDAIDEAEASANDDARAEAYLLIDSINIALGAPNAGEHARRALAIYEELEQRENIAKVLNNLGAIAYWHGDWSEALRLYERASATFEEIGDLVDAAVSACNVAEIFADQGRLDEAERALHAVVATWRSLGFPVGLALATRHLARVTLRRGNAPAALVLFEEARAAFAEYGLSAKVVEVDTWIAECHLHAGDIQRADALLVETLAQEVSSGSSEMRAMIHRLRGCAAAADGRIEDAWAELDSSLDVARSRGAVYDVALALEAIAGIARIGGLAYDEASLAERAEILARLGV